MQADTCTAAMVEPLPPRDPAYDPSLNHYWHYHGLETLLGCKQPVTASQDEDLFIAVHQICEIAFHQMILDLERTLTALATAFAATEPPVGKTAEACYFLERVVRLYEVANQAMPVLTTMRAFGEFRGAIGPTSGFQSFQFRHLEIMSGVAAYWRGGTRNSTGQLHPAEVEFERHWGPQVAEWLARHREHHLAHYYQLLVARAPLKELVAHPSASALLKGLHQYEQQQNRFHAAHLGLAMQQLTLVGATSGTGGTAFREYLSKYHREVEPLFPGLAAIF